ncbi:hypothetical protein LIER_43804 [Lithospermum erythrorhizon]|uniref:Uncharacterized protein n=1 Tax=Lithospermum erythrorhizon TaxID=34254 RepID=A0AAV3QV96_LITER
MKREGRQRGMIRTYPIMSQNIVPILENSINKLSSPPTAGLFTKVSQKPTNHSKFTGKCGRPKCISCHIHPASKSKDKVKGTQKMRSHDVVSNYKLITWGVGDSGSGLKFSGVSATGILDLLGNNYYVDNYDEDDDDVFEGSDDYEDSSNSRFEIEGSNDDENVDDDDVMSFCEVDLVWEQMDEDWCIVDEI